MEEVRDIGDDTEWAPIPVGGPKTDHTPLDPEVGWRRLEERLRSGNIPMNMERIRAAYEYASKQHASQKRRDGSPYVTHCIATAEIIAEQGLDEDSVVAALLHDVIEDTPSTHDDVKRLFGASVADIVEGVTKLTRVQWTSHEEEQAENLRKMLMAMAKDIRVILIKIADRLHNMRTMDYQSSEKQLIKSAETMEIYAPIAHRLGMQKIKWELEDRSLYYLDREGYREITEELSSRMPTLRKFMAKVEKQIEDRMEADGVKATVYGRIKHIYSIYRKMFAQQLDINGIFDLCAFRVIVDSIPDCYNALGLIHDMYKPVPGRFKDYVSTPKPNGYQSVHTTVIGSEGIPFEVQIRTWDMHLTAEYGVAAHWKYKSGEQGVKEGDEEKFAWVRRLLEAQQETDATEFVHDLKIDMFADEVFVFTPSGDVINLPAGATPIDFAYAIHSGVGNAMVGASVNGRIVTFDHVLQNGDIVEVRTSKSAPGPSRDWLQLAKSSSARTKIKQWFKKERREENIQRGRDMFDAELRRNGLTMADVNDEDVLPQILKKLSVPSLDELFAAIGYGGQTAVRSVNRVKDELARIRKPEKKTVLDKITEQAEKRTARPQKAVHGILVEGLDNCLIKFSKCCTPVPGDDIVGFITRGNGVSIHRTDCQNYLRQRASSDNEGRWIRVGWAEHTTDLYTTTLHITAAARGGFIMDIATVLNAMNAKVRSLSAKDNGDQSIAVVSVEVRDLAELRGIMNRLQSVRGVNEVRRASS
ncbi:MAG TPA: bifunctional (p)ppGpp synthetase/guanosine-3',5'-bis(diphosphate) 3'-pyrophosphohydrolase [Candidatus Scatomorpha merdigallinarum]|nr:bifunctional (p)ppGpp synthetase/guanosine-3',5'-bis(diphosphate) 3'-pyrophosphohydrolase [Candidatus Scatomorpha merdigallinarum]